MPDKYNPSKAKAEPEARHFPHHPPPSDLSLKIFQIDRDVPNASLRPEVLPVLSDGLEKIRRERVIRWR